MTFFRPFLWTAGAFLVVALAALVVRRVLVAATERWARTSEAVTDCLGTLRAPSLWWCVALGIWVANQVAEDFTLVAPRWHRLVELLLVLVVLGSLTVSLAGLAGRLAARATQRRLLGAAVTSLAQTAIHVAVLVVGFLMLLSTLGVHVTLLLATLGIGGLALALALQDTLLNVFAGIHLLADRPLRIGDYVKVGDQAEGYVTDVGWRSTRIRSLSNHVVVVPNQTVARATITNYDLPEPREALGLTVSVEYSADPERVERLLLDEVKHATGSIPGLLAEPRPSVSLIPGFGTYSMDFTVGYHAASFTDQYPVQHELRKRIIRRLQREGLRVPVPMRVA